MTQVACEPARGRSGGGAGKERRACNYVSGISIPPPIPLWLSAPSTELSDFRQSARSGNKRECKQTLKNTWKHAPMVTSLLSSPPISQQFRIDHQSAPDSLLVGYDTGGREERMRQLQTGVEPMTSWTVGQMLYHQATGDLVTDPREGPRRGLALLYFWTKLRPEGPKNFFFGDRLPPLI